MCIFCNWNIIMNLIFIKKKESTTLQNNNLNITNKKFILWKNIKELLRLDLDSRSR